MKIKTQVRAYEDVMSLPRAPKRKPKRPNILFRTLVRVLAIKDLIPAGFTFDKSDLSRAGKGPYLILMNQAPAT
jgi:hypothetical protein